MSLHVVPLAILTAYVVLTLVVANLVLRRRLGADHYLAAGRALPFFMVLAIILGDWLGGGSTIGVCQRGYNEGIVAWLYPVSIGLALFALAFTMAARYRRLGAVTVPEIMGRVFDARTRLVSAIVIGLAYYILAITQIIAGGALLAPLLGIEKWVADLIAALIFLAILAAGGLRSIALVNIVQCIVIYLGMLVGLVYALRFIGGSVSTGFGMLFSELPSSFWSFEAISPVTWSGEMLSVVLTCFAAQAAVIGIFAAKDAKAAVRGTWMAAALIIPIGIVYVLVGMCARIHYGPALPTGLTAGPAMMLALNPVVAGIALCGCLAAIMSTGPLCFLAPTQILMRDIYSVYINPEAPDKKVLLYSRVLVAVFIILGWLLGITMYDLLGTIFWAFTLRVGIAVLLLSAAYLGARYVSEDGAFWGLIAGFVALIVWTACGSPYGIHVAMPTVAAVFATSLVVSRFRKRKEELPPEVKEAIRPHRPTVTG